LADPFLLAHLVSPLFFDLGGRLAPISIRDQMVRARMAVDRAIEEGLIGPQRPLLAIGAGAAGATAAIHSASRVVPVVLIDGAPAPFLRQAGCRTRWIDPVQYDWPVSHWLQGRYPWAPPAMPLPWASGPANQIALAWALAVQLSRRRHRHLRVLFSTRLLGRPLRAAKMLRVTLGRRGRIVVGDFGMILSCVGAGTEQSTHGNYTGFDFWSTDPFQQLSPNDRVLISGGGDGALQDYLRVVTKQPVAKAIYSSLRQLLGPLIPREMEHLLQSAEDQASRVYVWGTGGLHDHGALAQLHKLHVGIVDKLLPGPGLTHPVQDLSNVLESMTAKMPATVTLMYPCSHFSRCYGLNRFIVLLLATYLSRYRAQPTLLPERSLHDVAGVNNHLCANSPAGCHRQEHEIIPALDPDCRLPSAQPRQAAGRLPGDYNVVIVRHGIKASPPLFAGNRQIAQPRQILPYHVAI
jgi:hypothetical protein